MGNTKDEENQDISRVSAIIRGYSMDQLKIKLMRIWIMEFRAFCVKELGETSVDVMDHLLNT